MFSDFGDCYRIYRACELVFYWGGPVPYLELFGGGPVKKTPCTFPLFLSFHVYLRWEQRGRQPVVFETSCQELRFILKHIILEYMVWQPYMCSSRRFWQLLFKPSSDHQEPFSFLSLTTISNMSQPSPKTSSNMLEYVLAIIKRFQTCVHHNQKLLQRCLHHHQYDKNELTK